MKLKIVGVALLAAVVLVGCDRVDPNSPLGKRTAIFKEMMKTSEDLGGMLRGRLAFNEAKFIEGAAHLDEISRQPWQHFPQVKDNADSSARDDVWERQERFNELARAQEAATAALVVATTQRPLDPAALAAPVQRVEDACESCHKEFRAY
jgi:cytochrome c556